MNQVQRKQNGFWGVIKNLFVLLIFLQFAPVIFMNIKRHVKKALVPKTKVGKLAINGMITSSKFYAKKIRNFKKDPDIKALLLTIDSPGGLPASAQVILRELELFKKEKPVVVFVENTCASAAYYIAIAGHIIALPSSILGSIGVFLQTASFKDLVEDWKIKPKIIHSGKYKAAGHPLKDLTLEDTNYLQKISDNSYKQFIQDVAKRRKNLDLKKEKTWADGKIFLGNESLKLGLIDQIGSYSDAIEKIKELAKIETEIKFVKPKKVSGIMRFIAGDIDEDDQQNPQFASKIADLLQSIYIKFWEKQSKPTLN